MNIESLKQASQAYQETSTGSSVERLRFLEGLWAIQADVSTATEYVPAEKEAAEQALVSGQPLFLLSAAEVPLDSYLDAVRRVADYIVEANVLPENQNEALRATDLSAPIERHIAEAGTRPSEFIALVSEEVTAAESGLTAATATFLLHSALVPFLSAPAQSSLAALGEMDWSTWGSGSCPVCGAAACMGRMGESTQHQGAPRTLWCSLCHAEWGYERLRCTRCGSRKVDSLRYTHLEEDPTHRAHLCDECHGYTKFVFQSDVRVRIAFPVEDAISADLDAVARAAGYSPEASQ